MGCGDNDHMHHHASSSSFWSPKGSGPEATPQRGGLGPLRPPRVLGVEFLGLSENGGDHADSVGRRMGGL